MARPVNKNPAIPQARHNATGPELLAFDRDLARYVFQELLEHAQRLNGMIPKDGSEAPTNPLPLISSTVAGLASYPAASWEGALLYVSNETGGKTVAFSDGTNWRRVQDRAVVS